MRKPDTAELGKIKGGIIGYMIGDALGLPVSGMTKEDARKSTGEVTHYITNFRHPFFYFLKKGQYGSTARLMLTTLTSLEARKGFDLDDLKKRLKEDALKSKEDFFYSRWLGQSVIHALLDNEPGSSSSITNVARSIPIALLFDDLDAVIDITEKQSRLTHISPVSLAASYFISVSLFKLKNTVEDPKAVFKKVLAMTAERYQGIDEFYGNLKLAIEETDTIGGIEQARKRFDTGSLAHQTIPLAVYIFLVCQNDFVKGVTAGANSYRNPPEKRNNYSYIEEMLHLYGGNGDAIAAYYATFFGVVYGYDKIPVEYLTELEDRDKTLRLIEGFFT